MPRDTNGKLTLLLFIEPSGEPNAEFPIDAGADHEKKQRPHHSVLRYACNLADQHVNKELNTIAAFLSDDAGLIGALMKPRELNCQVAMVPGGITNRMVRQLGILSADRIPNIFLLRRDGTIAWHASGLPFADSAEWVDFLAMKLQVEVCEVEHGYKALTQSDFETAARTFAGPFRRAEPDRHRWRAPRHHGRALALMGLKDWEAALEAIDIAIDAHYLPHVYTKNRWLTDWRAYVSQFPIDEPCERISQLWQTKIAVLDRLGRGDEAAALRKRRRGPIKKCRREPYASFHDKLEAWRVNHQETAKSP